MLSFLSLSLAAGLLGPVGGCSLVRGRVSCKIGDLGGPEHVGSVGLSFFICSFGLGTPFMINSGFPRLLDCLLER